MSMSGKVGAVFVQTADPVVSFTDEATTGSEDYKRYSINSAAKRYWDKNTAVIVKKNNIVQTSGFTVETVGGVIVFASALAPDDAVTVSGKYVTVLQPAGFFNWSVQTSVKTLETTCFESNEWDEFVIGDKSWKGSAEKFWVTDSEFISKIGTEVILALYTDFGTAKTRFEGYGIVEASDVTIPVNELVKEKIGFTGVGPLYFREG
jgi:hypothetical protein